MILGIMQPYFLPYIGYFQLINAVDRFFLYDALDYSRGGWINRNRILVTGQGPTFLTVSIEAPRATKTIRDTRLVDWTRGRRKLFRSIDLNYTRSPYYSEVRDLLEEVVVPDTDSLAELNASSISGICGYLGITTEVMTDSRPFDELEAHLRERDTDIARSFPWLGTDAPRKVIRALALCRALEADAFINPIGGRQLYDKQEFLLHDIRLSFIRRRTFSYTQPHPSFVPDLSIIDVLMNSGRQRTRRLLDEFDLI